MRFLRQSLTGLFLLALTLGLLLYAGQMVRTAVEDRLAQEPRVPPARERVFSVNVVQATPETIRPVLSAFGEVQSRRTLDIRAAVAGPIVELSEDFVEGGEVEAGQFLARIDPSDAQRTLERVQSEKLDAEAERREAERALVLARDDQAAAEEQAVLRERAFQRQQDLLDRGVGTAANVETAELAASSARQAVVSRRQAVAQAEARIDQAETALARIALTLAEAQRNLDDTEIRAGFAGTLSNVTVVEGGLVSVNEQIAQLVDADALEVAFRVSTAQYARLLDEAGALRPADVVATLDVYGTALSSAGQLSRDSAAVGEGQTGRLLFARLDQARGLKPGDFVRVEVTEQPLEGVVRLPSQALSAGGTVLVVGEENRLREIPVDLLRRQGDDVIVSAQGLAGQGVVAERTPLLGAGIRVQPLRPATGDNAAQAPPEPDMVELSDERRAALVAFVEGNGFIPDEAKQRILSQLANDKVPAQVIDRLESRMGG